MTFDPRVRLCWALCLTVLALLFDDLFVLLPLLAVALIAIGCTDGGLWHVFRRLRWLLWFFVIISVIQSVFNPQGEVLLSIGSLALLTGGGISLGVAFFCRMLLLLCSGMIIAAAGQRQLVQALVQLKLPYEIAFMLSVAILFLPMFKDQITNSLTAIQLRGVDIKRLSFNKRMRLYKYLLLPVITRIVEIARQLAVSMEMLAFRAYEKRTSYLRLTMTAYDYLAVVFAVMVTAAIIAVYYI